MKLLGLLALMVMLLSSFVYSKPNPDFSAEDFGYGGRGDSSEEIYYYPRGGNKFHKKIRTLNNNKTKLQATLEGSEETAVMVATVKDFQGKKKKKKVSVVICRESAKIFIF